MPATLNFPPVALTLTSGWQPFPLGDGGYVVGINVSGTGAANGAYCKTDVSGAYFWDGSWWHQVVNPISFGSGHNGGVANGVYEIIGAPTNYQKAFMVYGDSAYGNNAGHYLIFISSNGGVTSWTRTNVQFSVYNTGYWEHFGSDITNAPKNKFANQKIVGDHTNPKVVYVGLPVGAVMTDAHVASPASVYRTLDGGTTWAVVPGLPVPSQYPGYAGMCIDKSSSMISLTVGSQTETVHSRIILPCAGVGIYQSTNGGATFSKITSDPTPSTIINYTTTQPNCVIIVQVMCAGEGHVSNVTNTGTASLTWTRRYGLTRNDTTRCVLYEYYAVAPSAGTYNISVNYHDGQLAYWTSNADTASCTAGTVNNRTFTVGGTVTGTFAIGQEISGSGLPVTSAGEVIEGGWWGAGNGIYLVSLTSGSGSTPGSTWTINASVLPVAATLIHGRTRQGNMVNVFAVQGCDVSAMPGSAFDAGGPRPGYQMYPGGGYAPITTVANNCLIFSFGHNNYGSPGITTVDSGYTAMGMTANPSFWSEISTVPMAAGTRSLGIDTNAVMTIADALKQGTGMTIARNGTAQYAISGPSLNTQPVDVWTAQMDNSGTYWCIDGVNARNYGNIWRLKSGVWDCISGSTVAICGIGLPFGSPGEGSIANAICVDPRPGFEGRVTFGGPNGVWRGFQTQTGNAAPASMTWWGSTGGALETTVGPSGVPWLGGFTTTGTGPAAVGDMVQDPVTGKYWQAHGHGIHVLESNLNWSSTDNTFTCICTNESQGIEEMLVQQVLAIPGAVHPLVGVEDEMVLISDLPNPPLAKARDDGDAHAWGMDYASNNPAFVWAYITGPLSGRMSCWSYDYGKEHTWQSPVTMPPVKPATGPDDLTYGGCMACASTGADGLSPTNATASVVIIAGGNVLTPIYTTNNGNTWLTCSGLPTQEYIGQMEWCTTLLAADRVNIGTYYCYAPGTGVFRSINYGANWTLMNGPLAGDNGVYCGYTLLSVPGYAGHLFFCANWNSAFPGTLHYSTDGGDNWAAIPGLTTVTGGYLGSAMWVALGKAAPGNAYPTVFTYATINSIPGYYRGVCNGASPAAGFAWTKFGDESSTPPSQYLGWQMSQIWGDPNIYGRLYVGWPSNGVFLFNL